MFWQFTVNAALIECISINVLKYYQYLSLKKRTKSVCGKYSVSIYRNEFGFVHWTEFVKLHRMLTESVSIYNNKSTYVVACFLNRSLNRMFEILLTKWKNQRTSRNCEGRKSSYDSHKF